VTTRFDRQELLLAMERLHSGPDFLGIAARVFDNYLGERLRGASSAAAWVITENTIRSTDAWRGEP
jgi:hypothetical protein